MEGGILRYKTNTCRTPIVSGFGGFSSRDWEAISAGVHRSQFLLAQTTILFGERPAPSLQKALLRLEDSATAFVIFRMSWADQRSGRGELAYQSASITRSEVVLKAATAVLRELVSPEK